MIKESVDKLLMGDDLCDSEFKELIVSKGDGAEYLRCCAAQVREKYYSDKVYVRGLIEVTNYCKNDCLYCGIRRSNKCAERYRLSKEDILSCCKEGYELGFKTFVLQGGEDPYFTCERVCDIVSSIKSLYPECAVTLSLGEKTREEYEEYYKAGADRYLLRHETADSIHYSKLHPKELTLENRIECLNNLKDIGFQTGCGFMVGSPYQTLENIVNDLRFIKAFEPHMVGIGPFVPHDKTPFANEKQGDFDMTVNLLAIVRLLLPKVLLPATTALGTIHPKGREIGIMAGANVVMPNLSPVDVRKKYMLYNNKLNSGSEASEGLKLLENSRMEIGMRVVKERGDAIGYTRNEI